MITHFDEKVLSSPFIEAIWRGRTERAGFRIAPAGSCWVMLVENQSRSTRLSLVGPMSKAMSMSYADGLDFFAVKFRAGTYMPHLPTANFMDAVVTFPEAGGKSFWLNGLAWQYPDYENVETFVDRLVREEILVRDDVVDAVLHEQPLDLSPRSVQRRFLHSTGLTHNSIRQIARARRAMMLLNQGTSILDVVHQMGYTDQPHMTKSLKHFIGQTPAQIVRQSQLG